MEITPESVLLILAAIVACSVVVLLAVTVLRRPPRSAPATVTLRALALEHGQTDSGHRICNFIRHPDDGLGPFSTHPLVDPWELTAEEADRVRNRFDL